LNNHQQSLPPPLTNPVIDIGVNLTNKRFDKDRDEVIKRAKSA
jgi:TatD DNase family protein